MRTKWEITSLLIVASDDLAYATTISPYLLLNWKWQANLRLSAGAGLSGRRVFGDHLGVDAAVKFADEFFGVKKRGIQPVDGLFV